MLQPLLLCTYCAVVVRTSPADLTKEIAYLDESICFSLKLKEKRTKNSFTVTEINLKKKSIHLPHIFVLLQLTLINRVLEISCS